MAITEAISQRRGQPAGLFYLAATEALNAFALYGMISLLVLYMVSQALLPGHIENIAGFAAFRNTLETVFGPLSTVALASQIFGLYAGLVCFTPLFGGLLADRVLGLRRTVAIGATLMLVGHAMMMSERLFLVALLFLVLGSGCITGNLKAQVGNLYGKSDGRRPSGFAVSLIGINTGAFLAPLACGTVGELWGWHYGFGTAAIGMAVGLCVYLTGWRQMPADAQTSRPAVVSADEDKASSASALPSLVALMAINILYFGTYNQTFNLLPVWARDFVDRDVLGGTIPATWFLALDGLFGIFVLLGLLWFWRGRTGSDDRGLCEVDRIAVGFVLLALAFLTLASAGPASAGGKASIAFCFLFFTFTALATPLIWTSTLTLVSRWAPLRIQSMMMGAYALSAFAGNMLVGWTGRFYETLAPTGFWLLHALMAGSGLIALLLFRRRFTRSFPQQMGTPAQESAA